MRTHDRSAFAERRRLLIGYGLPLLGGALVAGVTTLIFWIIQNYLV